MRCVESSQARRARSLALAIERTRSRLAGARFDDDRAIDMVQARLRPAGSRASEWSTASVRQRGERCTRSTKCCSSRRRDKYTRVLTATRRRAQSNPAQGAAARARLRNVLAGASKCDRARRRDSTRSRKATTGTAVTVRGRPDVCMSAARVKHRFRACEHVAEVARGEVDQGRGGEQQCIGMPTFPRAHMAAVGER